MQSRAPPPALVYSSICWSPGELPNAACGRRPIIRWMPSGLPALLSLSNSLGSLVRNGLPSLSIAICRAAHGADDLFGRDSIGLLGIHAHEILAAAGADVSLVAIGAEIGQHFPHRLVGQFVVRLVPARVFRLGKPLLHLGLELFRGHARAPGP